MKVTVQSPGYNSISERVDIIENFGNVKIHATINFLDIK